MFKKSSLVVLSFVFLFVFTASALQKAEVTRVVDGDTIEVRFPDGRSGKGTLKKF